MPKLIFISRPIPDMGIQMLKDKGYEVDVNTTNDMPTQDDLINFLKQKPYDAVITLLTDKVDAKVFDACPTAKIYANYAIGFDNFDLKEAEKRGIVITNTPGHFSDCIAEHAMALMLALTTRLVEADKFVREGKYKGWSPDIFVGTDLSRKTLGLIGSGNIGARVAYHARKGFDMNILYYDVRRNEAIEKECDATYVENVEDVIKQADIVTLHVPLLDSTHHLMNAERLKMMKPTAFLINTSRGPVVDENALVEALKNKTIRGAGLDVFEFEPNLAAGLTELSNVVLTPHIASARESARDEMADIAVKNIIAFMDGEKAPNAVALQK